MTVLLSLILWLVGAQGATTGTIEGRLVRAGTNQPLAGESVGLWPSSSSTKTDPDGRFLFRDIPAGQYALSVVKDGIRLRVPLALASAQRLEYGNLEVRQAPAIAGTVFDPNGERVAAARVQAHRMIYRSGRPRLRSVMSVLTDDLGQYRLYRLRSGEYFVSASLSTREQRAVSAPLKLTPNLAKPDDGFPTVFFGGTDAPKEKVPVGLADTVGVDFYFREEPRLSISGTLTNDKGQACGRLALAREGALVSDSDFNRDVCGNFRIENLSPGVYVLLAAGKGYASDIVKLNLTGRDIQELIVTMVAAANIEGTITGDGAASATGMKVVLVRNSIDIEQRIETRVAGNRTFVIPDVGPGSFDIFLEPVPSGTYVRSIGYGVQDNLVVPVRINPASPGRIVIQLATTTASAEGVVVDSAGRPVPGAEIVLVPRTRRNREDRFYIATADGAGAFSVAGVPPEQYVLLAFDDIGPGEWLRFVTSDLVQDSLTRVSFNRYTARGQILTFNERAKLSNIRATAIPASETPGGIP